MLNPYVLIAIIALGFGSWPLVARASGASGGWITVVVMAFSSLTGLVAQRWITDPFPAKRALLILAIGGVLNGLGAVAWGTLLTGPHRATGLPPVAMALMIAVLTVGGMLFFKDDCTPGKLFGLALAMVGCWFMAR